jgi:hypothetical protein
MCRLALMNRQAVHFLRFYLDYVFGHLEGALGGDGNGVAGLWVDHGTTKVRKGVKFTAAQAAACVQKYADQGADWLLFHTRRATSSVVADQHCHPYQAGRLVMAHNGHDEHFAELGRAVGISDSECIARAWANMRFPLSALATRSGVFIGFAQNYPFVVKGQHSGDLLAAWHEGTGSILFASELPPWLPEVFDQVVEISTIQWLGREMNREALHIRSYRPRISSSSDFYRHWSPYGWTDDLDRLPEDEEMLYQEAMYEEERWEEPQRQVE